MVGSYYLFVALKERVQLHGFEVKKQKTKKNLSFLFFLTHFHLFFRTQFVLKEAGGSMAPLDFLLQFFAIPNFLNLLTQVSLSLFLFSSFLVLC